MSQSNEATFTNRRHDRVDRLFLEPISDLVEVFETGAELRSLLQEGSQYYEILVRF